MSKMTKWFPDHIKPFHVGVYEVIPKNHNVCVPVYAHWNGQHWGYFKGQVRDAWSANTDIVEAAQHKQWRGFTKPQE